MIFNPKQQSNAVQNAKARIVGSRHKAMKHWFNMLNRVSRRYPGYAHVEVRIEREAFIEWFMPKDFAGCVVDRIDPDGHYEFSNMRVITRAENTSRARRKLVFNPAGETPCRKCGKMYAATEFKKRKEVVHGRARICIYCHREENRLYMRAKSAQKRVE